MFLVETATDTGEGPFLALFVPLFDPESGTYRRGKLTQWFALVLVARLIGTNEPLVVPVPAMQRLITRGETFVAGSRTDVLDHVQSRLILLTELGRRSGENLFSNKVKENR